MLQCNNSCNISLMSLSQSTLHACWISLQVYLNYYHSLYPEWTFSLPWLLCDIPEKANDQILYIMKSKNSFTYLNHTICGLSLFFFLLMIRLPLQTHWLLLLASMAFGLTMSVKIQNFFTNQCLFLKRSGE